MKRLLTILFVIGAAMLAASTAATMNKKVAVAAESEKSEVAAEEMISEMETSSAAATTTTAAVETESVTNDSDLYAVIEVAGNKFPVASSAEYLHKDTNRNDSYSGTIFTDGIDGRVFYGHHMKDGSMFACLDDNIKACEQVTVTTAAGAKTYRLVLAVAGMDADIETGMSNPSAFIGSIQKKTVVYGNESKFEGADICLQTCDYNFGGERLWAFYSEN